MARERRAANDDCYLDLADLDEDFVDLRAALVQTRSWNALGFDTPPTRPDIEAAVKRMRFEGMVYGYEGEDPAGGLFLSHEGAKHFILAPYADPPDDLDLVEEAVALFLDWAFDERGYEEIYFFLDNNRVGPQAAQRFFDAGFEICGEVAHGQLMLRMDASLWLAAVEDDE